MQQLSGEEAFAEYGVRSVTKRGETIWVKTRSAPIDYQGKAALLTNAVDSTKRRAMEEALRVSEQELRVLASRLMTAQEDERKRIALELHDGTVATLAAIKLKLETKLIQPDKERDKERERDKDKDKEQDSLKESISMLQRSIDEIRRTMSNLRPSILDDLGILATINWYCREYQEVYTEIPVEKEISIEEHEIPDSLRIAIFRVMQEAMNNAAKHSKARRLILSLRKVNGAIELSVEDDGQGFDVPGATSSPDQQTGLGIYSMRERIKLSGGIFSIESLKGKGTSVRATWPI